MTSSVIRVQEVEREKLNSHAGKRLSQTEGADEDASVEGGIGLVAEAKVPYQLPCVWKDRGNRDWLGNSYKCCKHIDKISLCLTNMLVNGNDGNEWQLT